MRRERDGVRIVRLPTIRSKHLDTFIHTLLSTIHACFSNYDIVHYHCLGPSLFSIFPRLFGKKTVVTVQGLDWQRKKWGWLSNRFLKIGEWASARFPNQTIVVSRVLQDRYQSRHAKHTLLVPNGTEIREPRGDTHLHRLGLSSDGYVLFLGRFSREKNCNLLIEAFNKIDTSFKLVLAGGSSHTDDYAANLRKHASDRVLFLDWLSGDALAEVLSNAAFFVLPSDLEGLSLALLDAMGAGVCVLASDTPENVEAIEDTGFTFRRGDVLDLERMLTLLLSDGPPARRSGLQSPRTGGAELPVGQGCRRTGRDLCRNGASRKESARDCVPSSSLTPRKSHAFAVTGSSFAVKCRRNGAS